MPSPDSKNNFALLRNKILDQGGKEYWRSLEEFVDAPEFAEFVAQEYPEQAETWDNSLSRRNFVKVMGASLALAGLSGCVIQPPEKIVPYVRPQEEILPGRPLFFATSMTLGGLSMGLLAKSYDGRPIKLEGNPEHPNSQGSTDVRAQAALLDMYDPDRSQEVTYRGTSKTWQNFTTEVRAAIEQNRGDGGAGIRFLTETVTSPTLTGQFKQLATELPNARWVQYEPVNDDNALNGAKLAFGSPVHTVYKYDRADRVLSLDADIFQSFNVGEIKDYSKRRKYSEENKDLNRLYMVETTLSITGAKSDHRLAIKPSLMPEVVRAVAKALGVGGISTSYGENGQWIDAMAKDLLEHRGRSIVVAGKTQSPFVHAAAHLMNAALGNVGQTVIYTDPLTAFPEKSQVDQLRELITDIDGGRVKLLVILGGNPVYNTPLDLKLNADRMNKVPLRIRLGMLADETSEYCHWHISEKHFLESWSDGRAHDGTVSLVQPLIEPLYDSHSAHEVVQAFFKENYDKRDYDILKEFWQRQNIPSGNAPAAVAVSTGGNNLPTKSPAQATTETATATTGSSPRNSNSAGSQSNTAGNNGARSVPIMGTGSPVTNASSSQGTQTGTTAFEDRWRKYVHDGVIPNTSAPQKTVSANPGFLSQPAPAVQPAGDMEFVIRYDPAVYDGRFANNGWLQELPKPLSKTVWDNIAMISPRTAEQLGINRSTDQEELTGGSQGVSFVNTRGGNQNSDLVTVNFQGADIQKPVPMWITPGHPDGVITLFMGYGRTKAGRIGTGLGYSVFDVRRSDAMDFGTGRVSKRNEQASIASTQIHFNMEGRDLLRVWTLDNIEAERERGEQENFYDKSMYPYEQHQAVYNKNHKWGMSIDINSCVGCNACVMACVAENNIPVVGKEQVERSREMHWLRVDAYYGGDDINNPEGPYFQPLLCQQCEQAPCEVVCPVHATVHSAEGLNDMVYNRCVGTRYCSNNCPYKVRRFNFFLYQDWNTPQYKLMRNPEVSIRSRGVMEKCTYCTQRIAAARIEAEKDGRRIRDGEATTACQTACPTDAIIFGDMGDGTTNVAKSKQDIRTYVLLNELNTQPRTTYMAGLKNQNKEMPDYRAMRQHERPGEEKSAQNEPGKRSEH